MSRMSGPRATIMLALPLVFGLLLSGVIMAQDPTPIPVITSPGGNVPSVPTVPGGLPSLPVATPDAPLPATTEESQPTAPVVPSNAETSMPPRVPQVVASGCPAQVQAALSAAQITCGQIGSGEACLGSGVVEASPQEGAQIRFVQPGDRAGFSALTELRLRTLDTSEKTLALVIGKPVFPTSTGGSAEATMIVIGDVTLVDDGDQRPSTTGGVVGTVIADFGLNVRRQPDPSSEVVWQLRRGDLINITGQTADRSWYRMEIPNQFRAPAWVYAPYIQVSGNIPTVDPAVVPTRTAPQASSGMATLFQAMQAFNLLSGSVNAECTGAPQSGALIQTPNGMFDRMRLRVNDVLIELNGTVFLQAQANDRLLISVLEGDANITAQGAMSSTPKGFRASVALGGNLEPQGAPLPDSFDQRELIGLPVSQLPRMIELALLQQEMGQAAPTTDAVGFSATPTTDPLPTPAPPLVPAVGSLTSAETGELCGAPEVTLSGTSSGLGPAVEIGGLWRATAGTTINISARGGSFQPLFGDYIRLNSVLGVLARSGQEQSLTHTFATDSAFSLLISASAGNTVTVRVRCGA